jgi:SAM-dependent methyltransferase
MKSFFTSGDQLFGIAQGTFTLVECAECGLVRLDPRPTLEEVSTFYAGHYWFAGNQSTAGKLEELYRKTILYDHVRFAARALRTSGAPAKVLDVGCSGGLFLQLMQARGFEALGVDFSSDAARVAAARGIRVEIGELPGLNLAAGEWGLVTMYHVVEHLLNPAEYLKAAARLLHPQGRLIVQVPDRDCWEARMLGLHWTGLDVPRHIHVFRGRDVRRLLESCGFRALREKHFSWRDHPAGLASGIARRLDPVVRAIRHSDSSNATRLIKDLLYLGLVATVTPFTLLEAIAGKGSTIMVEACKV